MYMKRNIIGISITLREMSVVFAVASLDTPTGGVYKHRILYLQNLPDCGKQNLVRNLQVYSNAIEVDVYNEQVIRKTIVMGNRGIPNFYINYRY